MKVKASVSLVSSCLLGDLLSAFSWVRWPTGSSQFLFWHEFGDLFPLLHLSSIFTSPSNRTQLGRSLLFLGAELLQYKNMAEEKAIGNPKALGTPNPHHKYSWKICTVSHVKYLIYKGQEAGEGKKSEKTKKKKKKTLISRGNIFLKSFKKYLPSCHNLLLCGMLEQ